MTKITIVENIVDNQTDDETIIDDRLKILCFAKFLSIMSDAMLCDEYINMMAGKKNEIEKQQIKDEMAKRFFKQWANDALKR